jgi:hypothetical protein
MIGWRGEISVNYSLSPDKQRRHVHVRQVKRAFLWINLSLFRRCLLSQASCAVAEQGPKTK